MNIYMETVSALIRDVARRELLPRHGRLRENQVHLHSDGSLFTEADLRSEAALSRGLKDLLPGALVLGEEKISEDPMRFLGAASTGYAWIIDPIDGTGAFKRGEDTYGVMVSLLRNGETVAGWIYTPGAALENADGTFHPETDLMITAEKGGGCFIDGQKILLSGRAEKLTGATIAFACRNQDAAYEAVLGRGVPGYVPRNNSSYDYSCLLTGTVDATFYSEGFMPQGWGKCPPWDHAAGVLLATEAGGYCALPYGGPEGEKYSPLLCHDRLLVAANKGLFQDIKSHLIARAPQLCKPRLPAQPDPGNRFKPTGPG